MDTKIIRDLVKKHLSEKPRNTIEIKNWLSENIHLEGNYDLAAILAFSQLFKSSHVRS